ncbi:alkane hydroxylase MAH1-like [Cynara cardunculus var. scolymus]|uniref:Cytochrome P450 n=1 Tax=Cynara cardunculus var. scolymus TaxID=59895 RepID=A0A103Y4F8_CYNCS|nr:alkane hydroxylase MAH1-like [Cynara cardunculus var. scolymus]KVI02348.1 cytochrome P450 [Cynara cardunculus var. scolymus]
MGSLHWVCSSDIFVLFLVLLISIVMFLYRRNKCPPSPLINWPFFGMTPYLLLNSHRLHDFATDILKFSHGTFLFKGPCFANMDLLLTSDPANIHHILSKNFPNYPKGPDFRKIFDILGDGIFNSDDELWEIHRKTTMSIFKHPDFYTLLEVTIRNKVDKALLPLLHHFVSHDRQPMDLQEIFQRFTFDSICLLLLDYDPESLSPHLPFIPCEKAFTEAEEALLWRHVWPEYFWKLQHRFGRGKEKKMKEASKAFDEFIYKCLSEKERLQQVGRGGLLTSLMRGFQGQGGSSGDSRKFLKDTILNLMLAGRDTTSTGLSWFMYLVAKNPRVEDKIREEIEKQLGGRKWKTSLGAKELEGLVYLHGGLCEALRLYPPVGFEHKAPLEKDILPSGEEVDERTKIILSFYSMGRMEGIWGDECMEFRPERWFSTSPEGIRGNNMIKHEASYKFTAFHAGPRRCLGKEMGLIQMKMVAAALIYHYHVELVEGHQVCPSDSIILQMKYGLKVKLLPI